MKICKLIAYKHNVRTLLHTKNICEYCMKLTHHARPTDMWARACAWLLLAIGCSTSAEDVQLSLGLEVDVDWTAAVVLSDTGA